MEQQFCQSCTMPLDNEAMMGTQADGSHNQEYCKYCYQNGAFTSPNMSIAEMEEVVKTQMAKMHMPQNVINNAVEMLPGLKRWKRKGI